MSDAIRFNCHCPNAVSRWVELSAQDMHRYRVECGSCSKFIKWGKEQELRGRVASREKVTVTPYDDEPPPRRATLEDFLD